MSRFTEHFGLTQTSQDDWFDPTLNADTPLYVDPFLVFEDGDPSWADAHQDMVEFFALAAEYLRRAQGNHSSIHWNKATRMLLFPEPKEFALGLAMGHPEGSGTGPELAQLMAEALDLINTVDVQGVDHAEIFSLFCPGLGIDRISDIFCNVTKHRFIRYTQEVAKRHDLELTAVRVPHARWSRRDGRWIDEQAMLPASPIFRGGVLLSPKRFLKDIPRVTPDKFWHWAEVNEADTLRFDLNYDLGASMTKKERVEAARKLANSAPAAAAAYINSISARRDPYDVDSDPDLRVGWHEVGTRAAEGLPPLNEPAQDGFAEWVRRLMLEFKHQVEETDLWRALWNDDYKQHRSEKIVQAIASAMFIQHCKASDVDLGREADIGRGPVDFKFSAGWQKRALTEVKLIRSKKFTAGAEKQLPQYMKSERISCGFYLCVGFTDKDFDEERLDRVRAAVAALATEGGIQIDPIFVDARPGKLSASKL